MPTRLSLAVVLMTTAFPVLADTLATGAEIRAAISDSTVQGSMDASGAYTEFYAADGTIRGDGYTGLWTVEGDTMCFSYGEAPDCWNVRIAGDMVTWVQNGADGGTGTILPGNPNDY